MLTRSLLMVVIISQKNSLYEGIDGGKGVWRPCLVDVARRLTWGSILVEVREFSGTHWTRHYNFLLSAGNQLSDEIFLTYSRVHDRSIFWRESIPNTKMAREVSRPLGAWFVAVTPCE